MAHHIAPEIMKTTKEVMLWKSDNAIVQIGGKALAVSVMAGDEPCGYVFWGEGSLLLDTIVETERGAIGESLERGITKPFIMIGGAPSVQENLETAEDEDFAQPCVENRKEFLETANSLVKRLFDKNPQGMPVKDGGLVFAFPSEQDELDVLIVKEAKLVYKGTDRVFVAKGDNVMLTSRQGEVVISKPGRSVVVSKRRSPHIHSCHSEDDWWCD
jgi:hypothetical protein